MGHPTAARAARPGDPLGPRIAGVPTHLRPTAGPPLARRAATREPDDLRRRAARRWHHARVSPRRPASEPPRRRDVVVGGGAVLLGVAVLGGCGLRLEEDAPDLPLVPRTPYSGGPLLRIALARCEATRQAAAAELGAGGLAAPTARLLRVFVDGHDDQIAALRARLEQVQEPVPSVPAAPGSAEATANEAGTVRPTGTAAPRFDGPTLAAAAAAGLDRAGRAALAGAPPDDLVLLGGVHAARSAVAALLRVRLAPAPTRPTLADPHVAADLLEAAEAALYGLEVAATRATPARAPLARAGLVELTRLRGHLARIAGEAARPPRLGYALPFPVATPAAADRLAVHVHSGLGTQLVAATPRVAGSAVGLASLLAWAASAELARCRWGAPWRGLPAQPSA